MSFSEPASFGLTSPVQLFSTTGGVADYRSSRGSGNSIALTRNAFTCHTEDAFLSFSKFDSTPEAVNQPGDNMDNAGAPDIWIIGSSATNVWPLTLSVFETGAQTPITSLYFYNAQPFTWVSCNVNTGNVGRQIVSHFPYSMTITFRLTELAR